MTAAEVYAGSDAAVTKAYYSQLSVHGPRGMVALNLFRAQKCSARAKRYRGGIRGLGSFRGMAYDRKNWSIEQLCQILQQHSASLHIPYGWRSDPDTPGFSWVLYVDLPQGQVSFHSRSRGDGPDYAGDWDQQRKSAQRILAFCDAVIGGNDTTIHSDTPSVMERPQSHVPATQVSLFPGE